MGNASSYVLAQAPALSLDDNGPCCDKWTLAVLLARGLPVASTSRGSRCPNDPGIKQSKGSIWQFFIIQKKILNKLYHR